ncbi:teichoic acid D-Ala incorporation-associated protein DltX [Terrilactibacillus sp. S3-3]|nr:teichoic acid D-Ala incorporation-associated protein DltX [Terrilactibacillus sp. S3-3]
MKIRTRWYHRPLPQWFFRTLYYVVILMALVVIYGFSAAHTGTFIYNEF